MTPRGGGFARERRQKVELALLPFSALVLVLGACGKETAVLASELSTDGIPFADQRFDFGSVLEGIVLEHSFLLSNASGRSIIVQSIDSDCACTVSSPTLKTPSGAVEPYTVRSPVPANATLTIDAVFDTIRKRGSSEATISVRAEGVDRPLRLSLHADVTPSVQIDPLPLDLGLMTTTQSKSGEILITSPSAGVFGVSLSEGVLPEELHASVAAVSTEGPFSSAWKLSVTLGPNSPKFDNHFYQVQLDCRWPPDCPLEPRLIERLPKTVSASIVAAVSGKLAAQPSYFSFGGVAAGEEVTRAAEIVAPSATALDLDLADVRLLECEGVAAESVRFAVERTSTTSFRLAVTIAHDRVPGGTFRGKLVVGRGEELELVFFGLVK